jgi:ribonuclease G
MRPYSTIRLTIARAMLSDLAMSAHLDIVFSALADPTRRAILTMLLEDDIEKNLNYLITHKHSGLKLMVNPIMYAYLTKGWFWTSKMAKWNKKFKQKTRLEGDTNYHLTEYKFFDKQDEEIKL